MLPNTENQNITETQTGIPKVAILMCTYNGAKFLSEQLDSIASQTYANWELWVSDDGSNDETWLILEAYISKWGNQRLHIQTGPKNGFVKNFMSLVCNKNIRADLFAFSDQDDVWAKDKLESAIKWFHNLPQQTPALYATRTILVDANNNEIGLSPLFKKKPSFENALVQPIGGANTMVFNNYARKLALDISDEIKIPSHDWLMYLLVTGCEGKVNYDSQPSLRYRQHAKNLFGTNCGLGQKLRRVCLLLQGHFREWNEANIQLLATYKTKLTSKNLEIMMSFSAARKRWLIPRLAGLWKSGVYRQTRLGNIGLIVAAILNKV